MEVVFTVIYAGNPLSLNARESISSFFILIGTYMRADQ